MLRTLYYRAAILVDVLSALSLVNAATLNLDPTGQGCVDPQGFLDCYQAQANKGTTCVSAADNTCSGTELAECVAGCAGAQLAGNIGCWLQSCWNQARTEEERRKITWLMPRQVYSCEYQGTAIEYLAGTDLVQSSVDIPFYPPPDNVPGGCCMYLCPPVLIDQN
jgi:hypothetical protein